MISFYVADFCVVERNSHRAPSRAQAVSKQTGQQAGGHPRLAGHRFFRSGEYRDAAFG